MKEPGLEPNFPAADKPAGVACAVRALARGPGRLGVLAFVPLLLAHEVQDPLKWRGAALAGAAFFLAGSASALLWASAWLGGPRGTGPAPSGEAADRATGGRRHSRTVLGFGLILLGGAAAIALYLPDSFAAALAGYFILATAYAAFWRDALLVDVAVLSALHLMPLAGGAAAARVTLSPWLLAFSLFLFTSLAFAGRYARLLRQADGTGDRNPTRGYTTADLSMILRVGPALGYLAVLVLALYVNGKTAQRLYPSRKVLWLLCPLLLYWVTRVWVMVRRRALDRDALPFAADRTDWSVALLAGLVLVLSATRWWPF